MKARVAASVVLALSVALGATGCGLVAPQATTKHYDASDGFSGDVGQVSVRNAFIVTRANGGKVGNLVVTLVNNGTTSERLQISSGDQGSSAASVTLKPGEVKQLGRDPQSGANSVLFSDFTTKPGSLYPVYFQYGDATGTKLTVPVLDGDLADYKSLVPPAALPTPAAAPTETPAPSQQ